LLIAMPLFMMMPIPRFMLEVYPLALLFCVGEGVKMLERQGRHSAVLVLTGLLVVLFLFRFVAFVIWNNYGHRAIMTPPKFPTLTAAASREFYNKHARGSSVIET